MPPSQNPSSDPLANKHQAWSALFSEPMSELVQRYTASVDFDQRLWRADIEGSLAHAEMLAAQGVIAAQEALRMLAGQPPHSFVNPERKPWHPKT